MTDPHYAAIRTDVLNDLGWTDDSPGVAAMSLTQLQQLLGGDPTGMLRTLVNFLDGAKVVTIDFGAEVPPGTPSGSLIIQKVGP